MKAYKFLRDDMRSGEGDEGPWTEGETRAVEGALELCANGYHWSRDWYDALKYAPGNVGAIVEVPSRGNRTDTTKGCSRTMTLIAARNVERALRLWGVECAERALIGEREHGREPDERWWAALEVARRYAEGNATRDELAAARAAARAARAAARAARAAAWAACDAAWAACDAAWAACDAARAASAAARAACDAASAAARAAWAASDAVSVAWAASAAWAAELQRQRKRLNEMLDAEFAAAQRVEP